MKRRAWLGCAALLMAMGCGSFGDEGVMGVPGNSGPPSPPSDPPPTGTKWQGTEVEGACGRVTLAWVLIDEVCGGTEDPHYMEYFHAPIFRDGALFGDLMFAVDATHLWVLDVTDESAINRQALRTGIGEPLAVDKHGSSLLIAAGTQGLLVMDVSDPMAPTVSAQVALAGPALDVFVEGDTAYVATGAEGIAVVDLSAAPTLTKTLAVPGFAASVTARLGTAYVAACDTFAAIDVASGNLRSQTWLSNAYEKDVLRAPAKGVALVGDTAFVAAGRYGAVAVDISDPDNIALRGNCTITSELSFYASGVRAEGDQLFVAGGEWGILPLDVTVPAATCGSDMQPLMMPLPEEGGECSTDAPWSIVPWQEIFEPPPPGRDPIQTLPAGDRLYAFGDATRVALRAIDVRDPASTTLAKLGRYDEPRLVVDVAAAGDRVVVVGEAGQVLIRDEVQLLATSDNPSVLKDALAATLLGDGRWAVATNAQQLLIEGTSAGLPLSEQIYAGSLDADGNRVVVPYAQGAMIYDADSFTTASLASGKTAELPQALAVHQGDVFLAAPEWTAATQVGGSELAPHGVFDLEDIMDANLWRAGLPRRLLVSTPQGLAEVASLAGQAGLALHGGSSGGVALPPGTYVSGAAQGDKLYLTTADRGRYRSQLITISLGSMSVESVEGFTGVASGVAVDGDRLYVGDADRGLRVYNTGSLDPTLLGIVDLEVTP